MRGQGLVETALQRFKFALCLQHLIERAEQAQGKFEALQRRFNKALPAQLYLSRMQLDGLSRRLDAISPLATLARGYAIVQRAADGAVVRSMSDVQVGEAIRVRVTDGELGAVVRES